MGCKVKLVELTSKIGSGSTPTGGKSAYLDSGLYKLIRSQNIYNHFFSEGGLAYISEEQAIKLKGVTLEKDDILINITGDSVARVAMVTEKMLPGRVNQNVSIIRCNKEKINPHYLLAILTSEEMQRHLLSLAQVGGTRAALTKSMLENLEVELLEKNDQEFVGNLLENINSKIENNKAIINKLELICSTLFKNWFIDFEFPNEQGLPYRSSGGEMVESELGEIPKGWEIRRLNEFCIITSGYAFKSKWWIEKGIPVLKIKDITERGVNLSNLSYVDEDKLNLAKKFLVSGGEVVIALTGATAGKMAMIPKMKEKMLINQRVGLIKPICDEILDEIPYIYELLKTNRINNLIKELALGSAQPNISPVKMGEIEIHYPKNSSVVLNFNEIAKPFYEKIIYLQGENEELVNLRELLLPKLLSGEIEIRDESVVEPS